MIIAIDFDGTVVSQDRPYADVTTPPVLVPGARAGLLALKSAGHVLLLYSARANRALRLDPNLDPLVRAGVRRVLPAAWAAAQPLHEARYQQMLAFVARELPGVFDAVDDGAQGKPTADLFLDDRCLNVLDQGTPARGWARIARLYAGEAAERLRTG